MSKLDYSKWDRLELSDDEDIEVHPNIDKASFIRWKQSDIHRKREERKLQITQWKQELGTNAGLMDRIQALVKTFTGGDEAGKRQACEKLVHDTQLYEKERKSVLFDPESPEYLQATSIDEVFSMLISRLCDENKVALTVEAFEHSMPAILSAEIPKLNKRQTEVAKSVAEAEAEQNKKITSENIFTEKFSKTAINPAATAPKAAAKKKATVKSTQPAVEVLNPNFKEHQKKLAPESATASDDEDTLQDLEATDEKMLLSFSRLKTFEDAFKFIQLNPRIVSREYSDHLMAKAFRAEYAGRQKESQQTCKWALALSYCLQMGTDGTGLFFKRMMKDGPEAVAVFEQDVATTYQRIHDRCIVLREKEKARDSGEIDETNSNLTAEQAAVFKTFPKTFQDALMSGEMEKINAAFGEMDEATSKRVMDECQKTGLISVLSEEESKKYLGTTEENGGGTTQSADTAQPKAKGGMAQ